ncbi:MAG: hypothetical protein QOH06_5970 [Acidobacteriota bacterium]|nr:hypothetical protein [Acidobacteriota bacterium]
MPVKKPKATVPLPTPLARRLVRYVVGFGIGVGLGMAPFLGRVPGMEALLQLFPDNMHGMLLPVSVFLMGLIAAAVQFYSGEYISRRALRRRFGLALSGLLAGLVVFMTLHAVFVERVEYKDSKGQLKTTPIIIGFSRVPGCGCGQKLSNAECLKTLSLETALVESCWGRPLQLVRLSLSLSYLALTGGFAALIGLLLLQEDNRRRESAKPKRRQPRTKTVPSPPSAGDTP